MEKFFNMYDNNVVHWSNDTHNIPLRVILCYNDLHKVSLFANELQMSCSMVSVQ